jgi:glycosyltransferase involved in cell wall biosynthesis
VTAPLRVAFAFASRGIGGAERSMLRLMAHDAGQRLACRVIVPARENPSLRRAVTALGIPYHALSPLDAPGFYRLLRRERPEVLYLFGRFRTVFWAALARRAGVSCIVAAERSAANRRSDWLARKIDRHLVDAYVANSRCAAANLAAIVGPGGPDVSVVPNGVEWTAPVEAGGDGVPSLLCVSNITANKGQMVLLEVVKRLGSRHPGIHAILVGRDFTEGAFFRAAASKGLADTYTAVGFVDDVRPYLARATLAVLPTLRREGMPTSLLEAMQAEVPVVASRVGGVSEIVQDGTTGVLVPPGDASGLADAIARLLADPPARRRLASNARRYVLERHGVETMIDGHVTAFERALARRRRPARPPLVLDPDAISSVAHVTTADVSLRYLLLNQLLALREGGYEVTGISSAGPDVPALLERGIGHEAVAMTRRFTPLADLRSLLALYRLMRRRRFAIVHAHNPKPGLLAQLAARLAGVPVVVNTVHGFYFHDGMRPWARRFYVLLEKIASRCSDVILSQNEEDAETAVRLGIARPEKVRWLGNGIDLERFDPARLTRDVRGRTRAALGIAADAPVVGFVGRLVAEKGVRDLLAAAALLKDRVPGLRVLLVGGTDSEKPDHLTPAVASEMGLEEICLFAGVRQDMPELYGTMDVFVLPSSREGFPRAPMEASAMKVPCVVTDVRGCRQVVVHGANGFLVPLGDVTTLAERIFAVLTDPVLARRMGAEGRRRALQEFDERRVFATVRAEYERLLRQKGLWRAIPVRHPADEGADFARAGQAVGS